jgi:hypothetical protein
MPSHHISDLSIGLTNARAWLDEYQRNSDITERAMTEAVIST